MNRSAPAISVMVLSAGCTYNGSPIHAALSPDELEQRVNARWHLGMSPHDAERAVRNTGLKPESGTLPTVDDETTPRHGMTATVDPPGLRPLLFLYSESWTGSGELCFWFDPEERLERIAYRVPRQHFDHPVSEVRIIAERSEGAAP